MLIFADTADPDEIKTWLSYGVIDGVTTNPSIMLSHGVHRLRKGAEDLAALIDPLPLSVEVVVDTPADMLTQAREIASWAPNVVVKIPIITTSGSPCLGVIHALAIEGIKVNATACLSFGQAMLAAKAGATYVSIFAGRVADEGHDPATVIGATASWITRWSSPAQIIVGSIRGPIDIQTAALAGAHVVTVPPKFLAQLIDHKYSRFTVQQFLSDGQRAAAKMMTEEQLRSSVEARSD